MGKYYKKRNYKNNDDGVIGLILLGIIFIYSLIEKYWFYILILGILIILYFIIRYVIDLDLKSNLKTSKIYHLGNHGELWLQQLKQNNDNRAKNVEQGIRGEKKLLHSLEYSNIPMYILYDLRLEIDGYKAQIDVVAITKKNIYFLESKNLKNNIEIEADGTITRKIGKYKKGIKNPLTQNSEHQYVIDSIFKKENIKDKYYSWVVLTNDESYVNYRKSDENYRNVIMRNDKLIEKMRKYESKAHLKRKEEKIKEICDIILKYDVKEILNIKNEDQIITELKEYRKQRMLVEGVDAYIIFNDETLMELVSKRPKTNGELLNIKGFGEVKVKKYGEKIIDIINNKIN